MADATTVPWGFYIGKVNGRDVASIMPTYNPAPGFGQVDYNTFKNFTQKTGAFDNAGNPIPGINSAEQWRTAGQAGYYLDGSLYNSFKDNPNFKDFIGSYESGANNPNAGAAYSNLGGAFIANKDLPRIQSDIQGGQSSVINGEVIPSSGVKTGFLPGSPIDTPKTFDTGVGTMTVEPKTNFQSIAQSGTPTNTPSVNTPPASTPSGSTAGLFARTGISPYTPIGSTGQSAISTPSVQDYFGVTGRDASFANRAKEAAKIGITNYTGSAAQNTALLTQMRNADLETIVPGITKLPPEQRQPLVLQALADHLKQQTGLQQDTSGGNTGGGNTGTGTGNNPPGYIGISSNFEDNLAALNKVNANIATLTQELYRLQSQPYATQAKEQAEGTLSPFVQGDVARNAEINAVLQLPVAMQLQTAGINQANILKVMDLMKPQSLAYGSSLVNPFTGAVIGGGLSTSDQALVSQALNDGRLTPDMLQKYSMPSIIAALKASPTYNPVGNKADITANTATLTDLSKSRADTSRAITTADANFPLLLNVMQKAGVNDFDSPIGNRIEQAFNNGLIGSGDMAAFNALKTSLQTEYAQIISRGGTVTNQTRTEAENIVNGNISYNAMKTLYSTLQAEAKNVIAGYDTEITRVKGQLGNQTTSGPVNLNDPKFAF